MDWARLEVLLEEARSLPMERRSGFLAEACGDDADLLAQATSLLPHFDAASGFFSELGSDLLHTLEAAGSPRPLDWIGPYQLLEILGEGGMGQVWLAEQSEPVRRRVALKLIKLGMDTKDLLLRFDSERQALAVMDHPGIAKIFDGGATEEGRPYFVMEVVEGVPITQYCDTHRLRTAQRIRLFVQACAAVQHAHMKGVIHRDLKPSNVLVALQDSEPAVKVIDFGIAKAMSRGLAEGTEVTFLGQILGTPAYVSPEQAAGSRIDVDSRTDVYSLGVLLYELLAGALPFAADALRHPVQVFQFLLGDRQLPKPSARLGEIGDTQETVARARRTDARALRKELAGDLGWIVMKAMDKDRSRRYETVNGLAEDLERYLRHEPVVARPPSLSYRTGRFVRRNRAGVAAAAAIAATLLAAVGGTSIGLARARAAEARAEAAQAAAQQEAGTAEEVSRFMTSLFEESDPIRSRTTSLTAREVLDRGAERVRTELADRPVIQATLLRTIGSVYGSLSVYSSAVELLEEALAIQERVLGPNDKDVATTLLELSRFYGDVGRRDMVEPAVRRSLAIFEQTDGPVSVGAARAANNLASYLRNNGRVEESLPFYRQSIRINESLPDQDAAIPEMEGMSARVLAARTREHMATALTMLGRWDEADVEFEAALATMRRHLPTDHPQIAMALRERGRLDARQDRLERALAGSRESLGILERSLGEWNVATGRTLRDIGDVLGRMGRIDDADAFNHRALDVFDSLYGPGNADSGVVLGQMGFVALARQDYPGAEALLRAAIEQQTGPLAPSEEESSRLRGLLAEAIEGQGRTTEAAAIREVAATFPGAEEAAPSTSRSR